MNPVWYRSKSEADNDKWSWFGLIAEELAEIEPRLVHWSYLPEDFESDEMGKRSPKKDAKLVPDGVQYERLTVLLLKEVQKLRKELDALKLTNEV